MNGGSPLCIVVMAKPNYAEGGGGGGGYCATGAFPD